MLPLSELIKEWWHVGVALAAIGWFFLKDTIIGSKDREQLADKIADDRRRMDHIERRLDQIESHQREDLIKVENKVDVLRAEMGTWFSRLLTLLESKQDKP